MKIQRYFGIALMAISFTMLSIGTIPQTFAGTTDTLGASLTLGATCGVSVTGGPISYGAFAVDDTRTSATTVTNGGTVVASLGANAGVPSATGPGGGGFAAASDGITHIEPISMRIDVAGGGFVALSNAGTDVVVDPTFATGASTLTLETTATIVNIPVADPALTATIPLTATC